jgi:predicted RNA methylase
LLPSILEVSVNDKVASKLRNMADGLQKQIDATRAPRLDNTPKRQLQAASARIDSNLLERMQRGMRALADARDAGTLPAILEPLKTKDAIRSLLTTRVDHPSYYVVLETDVYHNHSAEAIALRDLMDGVKTAADHAADEETKQRQRIEQLEREVRFSGIAGFFPTPPPIIDRMLDWAWSMPDGFEVLEPSAGKGDICDAVRDRFPNVHITAVEINHSLSKILLAKGYDAVQDDFLEYKPEKRFDVVLMNPPFERGQDADHVRYAYSLLRPEGRLVAVMSAGIFQRSDRKATEFRDWFKVHRGEVEDLPSDAFKSAFVSTGVATKLVMLDRSLAPFVAPPVAMPIVRDVVARPTSQLQLF